MRKSSRPPARRGEVPIVGNDVRNTPTATTVADARSAAQLANYQQTVLLALEDTDNALSDYGRERQRLVHLQAAVTAGDQAAELAMKRFTGGVADFLTVLDAYRSALEVEDHLALGQIRTATALIAVYKALGGGWDNGAP